MNYEKIKEALDFYFRPTPPSTIEWLEKYSGLANEESKIILAFIKPKVVIEEYGLPALLKDTSEGVDKLVRMIDAWRSDEYGKFFIHLFTSYIEDRNNVCYALSFNEEAFDNCVITGKTIFPQNQWEKIFEKDLPEKANRERLAITNPARSSTVLSKEGFSLIAELYSLLMNLGIRVNANLQ